MPTDKRTQFLIRVEFAPIRGKKPRSHGQNIFGTLCYMDRWPNGSVSRQAPKPLAQRVTEIERRTESARSNGAFPIPASLDARFGALAAKFERDLAELEVRTRMQTGALRDCDRALAEEFAEQMAAFQEQMLALHTGFARTMGRLVEEQIDASLAERASSLEAKLRAMVREELENSQAAAKTPAIEIAEACPEKPGASPARRPWQVSFVSSFFAVACGLLALHYLVA